MHTRFLTRTGSYALVLLCCACGAAKDNGNPSDSNQTGTGGTAAPVAGSGSGTGGIAEQPKAGQGGSTAGTGGGGPAAGSGGTVAEGSGGATGSGGTSGEMTGAYPDPRGKCGLDTGFPDDNACLLPPAEGEGFQVHIGPKDYNNPDEINRHIFHKGDESSECFSFHTPNTEEIYYQTFVISGRAGTHHIINTMFNVEVTDGGFVACLDPGTGMNSNIIDNLPGASKAYMERGLVAPENKDLGRAIPANAASQADMHYFNITQDDLLREFWMNVYYVPKEDIKEIGVQIRGMGGLAWTLAPIAPGTNEVFKYSCPIEKDGRIVQLLGHYHAHGDRFTAYVTRGATGMRDKVFEMYDYKDPKTFQYDSITKNPMFSDAVAGAWTGQLDVKAGDSLDWECLINNDSDVALTYTNNVQTGEMCNLWGMAVGPELNCVLWF